MGVAAGTYVVPILLPPTGLPLLGVAYGAGAGGVTFAAPAAVEEEEEDAEASTGETSVAEAGTWYPRPGTLCVLPPLSVTVYVVMWTRGTVRVVIYVVVELLEGMGEPAFVPVE